MQKFNKDGTITLEWLRSREEELINKSDSVRWYIKFNKMSSEFKKELVRKYNAFLSEVRNSDAYLVYKNEDYSSAREMLINQDYKLAPAQYDPSFIEGDFFVNQYLWVKSEIDKQTDGFKLEDVTNALI